MTRNAMPTKREQTPNIDGAKTAETAQLHGENGVHIAGVTGSSPVSPTIISQQVRTRSIQCPDEQAYHIKRVRQVFEYDPKNGGLSRKSSGKPAGHLNDRGYRRVRIDGVQWREHRLVWVWCYGEVLPSDCEIDHINGVRDDNRIENLRKVTRTENQWNARVRKDNTSGYKGVSFDKKSKRWAANIRINGKVKRLGTFDTPAEAHAAYCRKAIELRGEFARTG